MPLHILSPDQNGPRTPLQGRSFNESFYRQLLDSLADGVYFVDGDRRITYWNRGAEAISGYTAEEVLDAPAAITSWFTRTPRDAGSVSMAAQYWPPFMTGPPSKLNSF